MNISINIASILFYLIPLALLSGPFLPDLFLSTISIIFLINVLYYRQYFYFKSYFFILFVLFYIYIVANSIFSDYRLLSLHSSLFYFRFGLFALATWYLIENNKHFINYFGQILLLTILLALVGGFFQYFTGVNFLGISSEMQSRLTLTFDDKLIIGGYIARLLPLLVAIILIGSSKLKYKYIIISVLFVFSDVLIYLSGERTALVLITILTLFLLATMSQLKLLRILSIILSIGLIVGISIYNPETKKRVVDLTIEQNYQEESVKKFYYFSPVHDSLARTSINIFRDNLVFGSGPNTFREMCSRSDYRIDKHSCSTHPHNIYLQLASETGIIGLLPILLIIFYLVYIISKHLYSIITSKEKKFLSDYQLCLISCFVLTMWPLLPTQDFFNNWINVIFYIPIGFYLSSIYSNNYGK